MANVLIVDDEIECQFLLQVIFQRAGHTTQLAGDAATSLATISQSPPDVIVLDDMLPDFSGSEVCRRLKGSPSTRHIPVLLYSAGCNVRNRSHLAAIGADAALGKPSTPRELVQTVDRLLSRIPSL